MYICNRIIGFTDETQTPYHTKKLVKDDEQHDRAVVSFQLTRSRNRLHRVKGQIKFTSLTALIFSPQKFCNMVFFYFFL